MKIEFNFFWLFSQHLKLKIEVIKNKYYHIWRLMQFIEFADSFHVHWPVQSMHTVVVIIQENSGFSFITSDSHKNTVAPVFFKLMKKIHQNKEFIIIFDADIVCKYPTMKRTEDHAIVILY